MEDKFFSSYMKNHKTTPGIPGMAMNAPLALNTLKGQIGLELEMEGARLPREGHLEGTKAPVTGAYWQAINDGSLRGESREFILSTPCTVEELPVMASGLWDTFNLMGTRLNNSNRCSTHVHINISGKTVNEITSAIVLWGTFEEVLINWCGEERIRNHHALSTKDAVSLVNAWDHYLRTGSTGQFGRELKYSALNVLPIWEKGSLEFRCGPASNDPTLPVKWATFIHGFVKYVTDKYKNPEDIGHDLSERGGLAMFTDICKSASVEGFGAEVIGDLRRDAFDATAMDGFRNVQRLALGHPWSEWMPEINKEFIPNPFAKKIKTKAIRIDPGLRPVPDFVNEGADEDDIIPDEPRRDRVNPFGEPENDFIRRARATMAATRPRPVHRPAPGSVVEWIGGGGDRLNGTIGTVLGPYRADGDEVIGWYMTWHGLPARDNQWSLTENLRVL